MVLHTSFEDSTGPIYIFFVKSRNRMAGMYSIRIFYDLYPHIRFFSFRFSPGRFKKTINGKSGRANP